MNIAYTKIIKKIQERVFDKDAHVTYVMDAYILLLHAFTLVFQNPQVIPCEDRCLEPLKAEPQEVFVSPNTYSQGIWKTRDGAFSNEPESISIDTSPTSD